MKSAKQFWEVIGIYNQSTFFVQIAIAVVLLLLVFAALKSKIKGYQIALKVMLALAFEWIGTVEHCRFAALIIGRRK